MNGRDDRIARLEAEILLEDANYRADMDMDSPPAPVCGPMLFAGLDDIPCLHGPRRSSVLILVSFSVSAVQSESSDLHFLV
eukprot:COSAG05_NODE_1164_length_5652_cov_6.810733_2_plen_81_part_00